MMQTQQGVGARQKQDTSHESKHVCTVQFHKGLEILLVHKKVATMLPCMCL